MSRVGRAARVGALVVVAAGIAVGAAKVPGTVELAPAKGQAGLPQVSNVLVGEAALVCPGQQRLGATGLRNVSGDVRVAASPASAPTLRAAGVTPPSGAGQVDLEGGTSGAVLATGATIDGLVGAAATGPVVGPVIARATGALAPGLVATQVWRRTGDDDRGLVVTPCGLPAADAWLLGGGAGASRTERLVVSNPGANAVTVAFDVFGRSGPVATAEGRSVSVPPRDRVVVSLDALAPDEVAPAVHVLATGGVVSAVLSDQWIEGATPRGIDDSVPAAPPATTQVVAGLDVTSTTSLRLVNPGTTGEALVQVTVLTQQGPSQPAELRAVRVPPGATTDVPLALAPGAYGLRISSDRPVAAAAWTERRAAAADRMGDFAWLPATPPVRDLAGAVLPSLDGATKRLLLSAGAQGGQVEVQIATGTERRTQPVAVKPDSTAVVDLGRADRVWVATRGGDVRAAVSVVAADAGVPQVAAVPLVSAPVTAVSVPVRQVGS
ncbi:hypothetical protein FHX52_3625 [Humibacillus xanthopallidus]|uniref:Uncharacterized protein n=1 Tax=Humibacillus xanthopallidus TaxID=412689 RepID=A0A543PS38_9MICO|nr:DUF5719 family protein [Humibacillus xanthopallidus]TQN46893.1 hypothetical protein FHX52_3625 [Humibacillus xanthopallidus]